MINIEDFVRKRLALYRAYEIRDRRPGRGKEGKLTYGPYLLFSREKGAGGSAVARRAGKYLGWQVFDSELVDAIAEKARVRRELIESLDERDQATILKTVGQLLRPQSIDKSGYRAHLREILLALGHQGRRGHRRSRGTLCFTQPIWFAGTDGGAGRSASPADRQP